MPATSEQAATRSRDDHILLNTKIWVEMTIDELTIEQIEEFAQGAEEHAHTASHEMTKFINEKHSDDRDWLTSHADHVRRLSAKIVLLRDGLVPALKIDKENPVLRLEAVRTMGYIRADIEAMECYMR